MLKRLFLFFSVALLICSCSCASSKGPRVKLGIDPQWYPLNFGAQTAYVNGFVEELLIEMAAYNGIEFEKMETNWDSLLHGMEEKKYDAVISSTPPYNFNLARYDFSDNFLPLGPVLVVSNHSSHQNLDHMRGELVGFLVGDPAILQVQKHPDVIVRTYPAATDLLNALVDGEIEGVVLDYMTANSYVRDIYADKLILVGTPLTQAGLHLMTLKGKHEGLIKKFNKTLHVFMKKQKMDALLSKWELGVGEKN
jgi:ABC-type amino acid transport substrate-binding protein